MTSETASYRGKGEHSNEIQLYIQVFLSCIFFMAFTLVISIPFVILVIAMCVCCYFLGRARGRQDIRTQPQVFGVPIPPPGVSPSGPSPPHSPKQDKSMNVWDLSFETHIYLFILSHQDKCHSFLFICLDEIDLHLEKYASIMHSASCSDEIDSSSRKHE